MAGHMGDKYRTTLNLEIIRSDQENNLLYIKGSIPGSKNSEVFLRDSIKSINKKTVKESLRQNLRKQKLQKIRKLILQNQKKTEPAKKPEGKK